MHPLQPLCVRRFGRASAQAQGAFRRRARPACTLQPLCVRRFGRGRRRCTGWQRCASAACHTGPRGRSSAPMLPPLPAGQDSLCIRRLTRPPAPAHTSCRYTGSWFAMQSNIFHMHSTFFLHIGKLRGLHYAKGPSPKSTVSRLTLRQSQSSTRARFSSRGSGALTNCSTMEASACPASAELPSSCSVGSSRLVFAYFACAINPCTVSNPA